LVLAIHYSHSSARIRIQEYFDKLLLEAAKRDDFEEYEKIHKRMINIIDSLSVYRWEIEDGVIPEIESEDIELSKRYHGVDDEDLFKKHVDSIIINEFNEKDNEILK